MQEYGDRSKQPKKNLYKKYPHTYHHRLLLQHDCCEPSSLTAAGGTLKAHMLDLGRLACQAPLLHGLLYDSS
jgi:hypothetical protein